jgi:hypothetical protein
MKNKTISKEELEMIDKDLVKEVCDLVMENYEEYWWHQQQAYLKFVHEKLVQQRKEMERIKRKEDINYTVHFCNLCNRNTYFRSNFCLDCGGGLLKRNKIT